MRAPFGRDVRWGETEGFGAMEIEQVITRSDDDYYSNRHRSA